MPYKEGCVVRLRRRTYELVKEIAERLGMTLDQVVYQAVSRFATEKVEATDDVVERPTATVNDQTATIADLLFLTEPLVEFATAVTQVYPDLKAEAGLTVIECQNRWLQLAREIGLITQQRQDTPEAAPPEGQETEG